MTNTHQSTPEGPGEHIAPAPRVAVQAFCETVEAAAAIQAAGEDRRLAKVHLKVQMGGIPAAVEAYGNGPTSNVVILESEARANELIARLDSLAEVCDAGTRVLVIGRYNDVLLYRELLRRGIAII
jgi:pilus assembly protein CpaE